MKHTVETVYRKSVPVHLKSLDWDRLATELDREGFVIVPGFLDGETCATLAAIYGGERCFWSRVVMARHRFGRGEYIYFDNPLPPVVAGLRAVLYPPLSGIANRWNDAFGIDARFPDTLPRYLDACHTAGQTKPTPLILKYEAGDHNCLHQDIYGEMVFPLQTAILLSRSGENFSGGEFVMTEQRPRMQSRVMVVPLQQGGGVIFPVRQRPVQGVKRCYRVNTRHGVSRLSTGRRFTLGVIFHDTK